MRGLAQHEVCVTVLGGGRLGGLKFFGVLLSLCALFWVRYALYWAFSEPLGVVFWDRIGVSCGNCVLLFIHFGTWWLAAERRCRRESALSFLLFAKLHTRFSRTLLL